MISQHKVTGREDGPADEHEEPLVTDEQTEEIPFL